MFFFWQSYYFISMRWSLQNFTLTCIASSAMLLVLKQNLKENYLVVGEYQPEKRQKGKWLFFFNQKKCTAMCISLFLRPLRLPVRNGDQLQSFTRVKARRWTSQSFTLNPFLKLFNTIPDTKCGDCIPIYTSQHTKSSLKLSN